MNTILIFILYQKFYKSAHRLAPDSWCWTYCISVQSCAMMCVDLSPTKNFMSVIPNNMGRRAANVNVLCQQLFNCTKNFDCNVSGVAYWWTKYYYVFTFFSDDLTLHFSKRTCTVQSCCVISHVV